jgi:CheY-like chemotaxis protein
VNSGIPITEATVDPQPVLGRAARHPRILCVDDHEFVRDQICALLLRKGWGCQSASGGAEALHWLTACREPVDLLITDHRMPGMSGLELVRQVRAANFTGKILVHSSLLLNLERAAYQELNVDAIVAKTGNPEPLLQAIAALQPV